MCAREVSNHVLCKNLYIGLKGQNRTTTINAGPEQKRAK